jgi:hypothetical protein
VRQQHLRIKNVSGCTNGRRDAYGSAPSSPICRFAFVLKYPRAFRTSVGVRKMCP